AEGGPIEDWMAWLSGYHRWLRAALWIKPRVGRARALDAERTRSLARDATAYAGAVVTVAFVHAVAKPPGGRINTVVFAELAGICGAPEVTIKRALFPRSRRA